MKMNIEVSTRTFIRFWLVSVSFVFAVYALYSARVALTIVGVAFFLAVALNNPVSKLAYVLPGKSRILSTALAFLMIVVGIVLFIMLALPPIIEQSIKLVDTVPTTVESVSRQWNSMGGLIERYHLQPQIDTAASSIQANLVSYASAISNNFVSGVGSALSGVFAGVLTLVLTFLMLVEGPIWMARIWSLYGDKKRLESHKQLVGQMKSVVSGYISGQLTVSGIGALAGGFVVFLISHLMSGVPGNLALPAVALLFLLSLIPMFGATIGGALVAVLLAINNLPAGLIFITYYIIYQQIENNLISPLIQSKTVELSPLAILSAVTIGIYVFGLIGAVISIPIAGCIKVLTIYYVDRNKRSAKHDEAPLAKLVKKVSSSKA